MNFKDTSEINVSNIIIDQIIGQDNVINIIKKASKQRRHVLLIGNSGTGKSMAGQGMAELLPQEKLVDILSIDNPADDNNTLVSKVKIRGYNGGSKFNWFNDGFSFICFIHKCFKKSHNRPANQSSKTISRQFNNKQSPIHRCIRSPGRCFTWNSTSRSFAEWGFRYTRL